jgi:hypothetical protein
MTLSVDQRRIVAALAQGHRLLTLRSPLDGRIVGAHLWDPETNRTESIALWRVERLVRLGLLHRDARTSGPVTEWTVVTGMDTRARGSAGTASADSHGAASAAVAAP